MSVSVQRALCAGAAIGIMAALSDASGYPLMSLPFTTSIVMVLGSPDVAAAQPRRILGGHLLCAASGIACTLALGFNPLVAALAIALAIFAMLVLDVFHPPAGITPMIIVATQADPVFILSPVLVGALTLIGFAAICNSLARENTPKEPN